MSFRCLTMGAVCALTLVLPFSARAAQRLAIVVGNNAGAPFAPRLQYSVVDADRLTRTLVELGQFAPEDVTTLKDQDIATIRAAFEQVATRIRSRTTEPGFLFFYYSGHANTEGLEVGADVLPYAELKALMTGSPAQTRVAVLDACDSGSLTRVRGAKPVPLITLGEEESAEGIVYISSTAIGEPAQESSALQAGFFTSHLDAALRGAADEDHDGRVTLSEAFRYSSTRTTEDTLKTQTGPQHPTYTMNLAGRGEVVLTDLRHAEAVLILPPAPGATYALRGPRNMLQEVPGTDVSLQIALPPGPYEIERRTSDGLETKSIQLQRHATYAVNEMELASLHWTRLRGGTLPLHVSFGGLLAPTVLGWNAPSGGAVLALSRPVGPIDLRVQLALSAASIAGPEGRYALWSGQIAAGPLWPVLYRSFVLVEVGPQIGLGRVEQIKPGVPSRGSMDYLLAGTALATFWAGPVRWGPFVSAETHMLRIDSKWSLRQLVTGGVGVGF